tara:strand:+ start:709 stop:960 length:252 start_codon:yes stop_codon:yes gene_type:complete
MKITKTHLAKLIKEELGKTMRYAENKETGRWEEVVDGAEPQAPRRGSAREDIEDAIQMLESEDDVNGTLYHVIERLYTAIENL